ncbi:MAG: dockerin type I domain-containing protein [Planctomycetota bacterium]
MKNPIAKLLPRLKSERRTRENRKRRLELENLENRQLLAADFGMDPATTGFHAVLPPDVNGDGHVSALDALHIINLLNNPSSSREGLFWDTNGDGSLSAIDALIPIDALNNVALAEDTPLVEFSHDFVDQDGNVIAGNQVTVGQRFAMRTFVRDTRMSFTNPARGVLSAFLDVGFDNTTSFDIDVGEVQQLRFFIDKLAGATNSSFTLSFDGQTTDPIFLIQNGQNQQEPGIAQQIENALAALPNVGVGNVRAQVDTVAKDADARAGILRFNFDIRFIGDLTQQNLPTITLDPTNVAVQPGESFDFEVNTIVDGDQSTPDTEYASVSYNTSVYEFGFANGNVLDDRFDNFGAISPLTDPADFPSPGTPTLLYTVPMIGRSPGVVNFSPGDGAQSPDTDILIQAPGSDGIEFFVVPPTMVDFGGTVALTVVSDPTAPIAQDDSVSMA